MKRAFRPTDRGKQVLDGENERVGTITGVSEETARVRLDCEVETLGDAAPDDDGSLLIDADSVDRIDAEAARLKSSAE